MYKVYRYEAIATQLVQLVISSVGTPETKIISVLHQFWCHIDLGSNLNCLFFFFIGKFNMHVVCYEYMTPSSILLLQGEEVPFELEFFGDHKCSSAEIDLTLTFFWK